LFGIGHVQPGTSGKCLSSHCKFVTWYSCFLLFQERQGQWRMALSWVFRLPTV
jgi:hypothetical protein